MWFSAKDATEILSAATNSEPILVTIGRSFGLACGDKSWNPQNDTSAMRAQFFGKEDGWDLVTIDAKAVGRALMQGGSIGLVLKQLKSGVKISVN
jgi:hypothetical protein